MARVPRELTNGPFTLEQATGAGLQRWHHEGSSWHRLGPRSYMHRGLAPDPLRRLQAANLRLPRGAAFSGFTAAWLHGMDVAPCDPIEITVPMDSNVTSRSGMRVRRAAVVEMVRVRGLPATPVLATVSDLCRRLDLVEAVVVLDAAVHARLLRLERLVAWADANGGRRGIGKLRRAISQAEPASESPMESRLRMLLVLAGLPRPAAQVPIHDSRGHFVGRPDLYYEEQRLGIEYDGAMHRETLAQDNRRQNRMLQSGYQLLRFTAADVLGNPESVVAQVRFMLGVGRGVARPA